MLKYVFSLSLLCLTTMALCQDLKVISHSIPNEITQYQKFFGTSVTLANEGILPVGNFYGAVYLSEDDKFDGEFYDPSVGYFYTGNFEPGLTYEIPVMPTSQVNLSPGQYHLIIVLDTNGDITETDEVNNTFVDFPVTVNAANVDFSLSFLDLDTDRVPANGKIHVIYTVDNTGESQVTGYVTTYFFLSYDGVLDESDPVLGSSINDIQLGRSTQSVDMVIPAVQPGVYLVFAKVDCENSGGEGIFSETDESNNTANSALIIDAPDLDLKAGEIMSFSLEQHDSYQPNYFKQIEYSVTNLGTTSGNDFSIEYYLSEDNVFDPGDFLLDTERFSSISTEIQPGETKSLSDTKYYLDFPLTSGEYYVIVNLNSDHAVEEKDYSNNVIVSASPFLITEPVIHYVELESASVPAKVSEQDTKFDVELVFNNTSPGDYDWEVRATFRLFNSSGVEIGLIYNDPYVRADQGKVVTVEHSLGLSQKLSPGNYTLQISMGGKTITTSVRAGDNLLLSGEVKGDDGTSITRGVLHLYEKLDLSLRHVKSIAVTGSSYYELDIHPKNYTLYFVPDKTDHPQFVPTIYDKALQVSEADYFATTADLSLDVEVLKLKPIAAGERSIVGQLTSGANSEGTVASIDDLAVRLVNSNNEPVGLTYTDAEGRFDFTGLPEGNYSIIIGNVNVDELITHSISVEVLEYDLSIVIDWETHISQVKFKPILSLTPFPAKIFGDAPFQPEINTSSSQVVTLESSDPDVAIIEDGVITITGAGTATITARQEETDDFTSAVSQQELKVEKAEQTISFTLLPEVTIADGTIELEATTTFGLPVIFTSQHPEIASIEGNLVTIHAVGVTEITAVQEGDQNVKAAPEVTRTLKVNAVLGIDADNFIRAYPNPTSGKINISGMDHIHSVIVINTLGKRIELPLEDGTIDLSDHTAGVYLVQVKTTSRLNSIRVIRK